jgi:TRAP-type mannitol/chloroaromatic compound transport system permease small subunit
MRTLLALASLLALPCHLFARAAGLTLLLLTGVIIYDVIGRRFFSTGSFKLQELQWHLHGAIAVLAFGYAYIKDAHVRIDIFAARIGPRTRLWLELLAVMLFVLPFMGLLLWYGYNFAERSFVRNETSSGGIGLSNRWIIKSAIPVSALLMIMGGLSVALRVVVALRAPHLRPDPFERDA